MRRELGLPPSRLEAAGYLAPEHRTYLDGVTQALAAVGLAGEFRYHGTVDRPGKVAFLQGLDVTSVPSPYAEPKGLYLLEALATGVPVVEPRHGAFPEVVEKTGGGVLFEPGSVRDLSERLMELHRDPGRRRELGRSGSAAVRRHYSAARMAERTLEICEAARGAFVGA
jgi:glycosyltransferase involved in cell wall biosynthesis